MNKSLGEERAHAKGKTKELKTAAALYDDHDYDT